MKDSTIITITNVHGSKSFTMGQITKKILRYIVLFSFLFLVVGALLIYTLSAKVGEYKIIQDKYHKLLVTNSNLEMNINKKENELLEIQEKVLSPQFSFDLYLKTTYVQGFLEKTPCTHFRNLSYLAVGSYVDFFVRNNCAGSVFFYL